jgi:hypothetical protein
MAMMIMLLDEYAGGEVAFGAIVSYCLPFWHAFSFLDRSIALYPTLLLAS